MLVVKILQNKTIDIEKIHKSTRMSPKIRKKYCWKSTVNLQLPSWTGGQAERSSRVPEIMVPAPRTTSKKGKDNPFYVQQLAGLMSYEIMKTQSFNHFSAQLMQNSSNNKKEERDIYI